MLHQRLFTLFPTCQKVSKTLYVKNIMNNPPDRDNADEVTESIWHRFTRFMRHCGRSISSICRRRSRNREREIPDAADDAAALRVTGVMLRNPNHVPGVVVTPALAVPERPPRPMTLSRARCTPRIPTLLAIEQALDDVKRSAQLQPTVAEADENKMVDMAVPGDASDSFTRAVADDDNEDWEVWDMEVEADPTEDRVTA